MREWRVVFWFLAVVLGKEVSPEKVTTIHPVTLSGSGEMGTLEADQILPSMEMSSHVYKPKYPQHHTVQHAGLPRELAVYPIPLEGSDHELMLNVSWLSPLGPPAKDYSIEVRSVTDTMECKSALCYEYNIPGVLNWWSIPSYKNSVAETCAVRPGCAYRVRLIAHPWDGHTSANLYVKLDECVSGVCSCAHSPRLPTPLVNASLVTIHGDIFINVSWVLPPPAQPQRLPPALTKQYYFVSIGKQMVSNAHPSPWFAHTVSRKIDADGLVANGDGTRWLLLPIAEQTDKLSEQSDKISVKASGRNHWHSEVSAKRSLKRTRVNLDVKLLARVSVIDERGCVGPVGNATAFDPGAARAIYMGTYFVWAALGGTCVLAMVVILAMSLRIVKKILNKLRPAPVSASLEPLRQRPAWFPVQFHT